MKLLFRLTAGFLLVVALLCGSGITQQAYNLIQGNGTPAARGTTLNLANKHRNYLELHYVGDCYNLHTDPHWRRGIVLSDRSDQRHALDAAPSSEFHDGNDVRG